MGDCLRACFEMVNMCLKFFNVPKLHTRYMLFVGNDLHGCELLCVMLSHL